jgi:F-box and WD-40 domain protein CDC4
VAYALFAYRDCLALLQGHTSLVGQLQLTDSVLVTGGSDGRVIVFSLATLECLHRLCAHDNSVTCLQFDDRFIVTGGNDGRVKLFDFKTGKLSRYSRGVKADHKQVNSFEN